MISLTSKGEKHIPQADHNIVAWGAIKELLRANGGTASRERILEILDYCYWRPAPGQKLRPNKPYLGYALEKKWLIEGRVAGSGQCDIPKTSSMVLGQACDAALRRGEEHWQSRMHRSQIALSSLAPLRSFM
jgi:hypothetical protein